MPETAPKDSISTLTELLRRFAAERSWDVYHTPKNLVLALVGEVGELAELYQWLTPEEAQGLAHDPKSGGEVRDELADVALYVLRLADVAGVDLAQAMHEKIAKNAVKYPVDKAKGHARKYTDL